ncbi:MAG: Acyl-CoA dehydrogenase, partial [uncultured Pseudonocardia sp.]
AARSLRRRPRRVPRHRAHLPGQGGRAAPRAVGGRRVRGPRGVDGGGRGRAARHRRARGVRRRRGRGLPLQLRPHRGDLPLGVLRARLPAAERRRRALPAAPGHARAEAALVPRLLLRRDHHRDRDDRAGHGLGPPGHPHHRAQAGRRRLGAERVEDVHHQRHPVRPGDRGREDRPRRRRARLQPARRRARDARLRARPQPRQGRPEGAGHRRAVLHRHTGAGGEPPRRGGPGLHPPDAEPRPGTAVHRRRLGRRRRGGAGHDAGPRPGAHGLRQAGGRVPEHPLRAGGDVHRDRRDAGLRRPVHPPARRDRAVGGRRSQGEVVGLGRPQAHGRPLRAAARRLRLHARAPDRQGVRGLPRAGDLRRHERDHEGDHRPDARRL